MNRAISGALLVILCAIAIAAPIAVSIRLAEWQGYEDEMQQQRLIATGLSRRADATNQQIIETFKTLQTDSAIVPCSPSDLSRMQGLALGATFLKGIGYMRDNRMLCSSIGNHGAGFDIGKPDFVLRSGAEVWLSTSLPFSSGKKFFVFKRGNYAVISHQELTIDVLAQGQDVNLGIFTVPSATPMFVRGKLQTDWVARLKDQRQVMFSDSGYLVAVKHSDMFDIASVSAIPVSYAYAHVRKYMLMFLPAGAGMGIALAVVIVLLARRRLTLNSEMQSGLRKDEFHLLYQPVMDLRSGRCIGAEALVRWRRSGRPPVGPDVFIPVAEQSGLIRRITGRVLEKVGHDVPLLLSTYPDFHIGVNLSYLDLQADEILAQIMRTVESAGISPHNIVLEATERGLLNADTTRDIVRAFRSNGLKVAIDDFGTGYSSLAYLANFDLDYLKIDKSFVDTLGTDAATSQVALHIIEMSKSLKLDMIAEGVETEEQAAILRERGVQYAQGWLFAKPMSVADLMRFIASTNAETAASEPRSQLSLLDPLRTSTPM